MLTYLTSHPLALASAAAILGLLLGSFLNVVIYRLPVVLEHLWRQQCAELDRAQKNRTTEEKPFNLVSPRSRCPHCGHGIGALENIPILSFIWLRGKCSACNKPISWRYPLVELLTALLSFVVAWHFGASFAGLAALALTWSLIALAFIDYDHQILPDDITLPLLWAGLLVNLGGTLTSLPSAVLGAAAGYGSLWLVYHAFRLATGKEGMGFGDFKLFAALGAWLGWQQLPLIILFASFFGALIGIAFILFLGRDRRLPIPFGPFLCAAGWVALLWGQDLTRYYLQFMRLGG
jgi:leader peptidase (prepilin peptidase)/N-methyltransferase